MAQVERMTDEEKAAFLVDIVDLHSTKRQIGQIKARLDALSQGFGSEDAQELFRRATQLQKKQNELQVKLATQN